MAYLDNDLKHFGNAGYNANKLIKNALEKFKMIKNQISKIQIGDKIEIIYTNKIESRNIDGLNFKNAIIISKYSNYILVQDVNNRHKRTSITLNDLISETIKISK